MVSLSRRECLRFQQLRAASSLSSLNSAPSISTRRLLLLVLANTMALFNRPLSSGSLKSDKSAADSKKK